MTPIRTTAIEYLCTAIDTIQEIKTVERFEPAATDLDTTPVPATFIYDVLPSTYKRSGKFEDITMELLFVTFIDFTVNDDTNGFKDFSKTADTLEVLIHRALTYLVPSTPKVVIEVVMLSSERIVPNTHQGELHMRANVTYRVVKGNGFSNSL